MPRPSVRIGVAFRVFGQAGRRVVEVVGADGVQQFVGQHDVVEAFGRFVGNQINDCQVHFGNAQ